MATNPFFGDCLGVARIYTGSCRIPSWLIGSCKSTERGMAWLVLSCTFFEWPENEVPRGGKPLQGPNILGVVGAHRLVASTTTAEHGCTCFAHFGCEQPETSGETLEIGNQRKPPRWVACPLAGNLLSGDFFDFQPSTCGGAEGRPCGYNML